jgi:hypothetical protein
MNLRDILDDLDNFEDNYTIFLDDRFGWTEFSDAQIIENNNKTVKKINYPYFIEISVIKNILSAYKYARNGRVPNLNDKCRAVLYYADNDAYLIPENE